MAHTDTTISNLKINRGTYANIQANLASIGENELIITTDKSIPVPSTADSGKVVSVNSSGDFILTTPPSGTTYTFADGTNSFTVTPAGGAAQTVTVTPSITNNITGTGTSGSLVKFNGNNTITDGPALGSATTTFLRNDGTWAIPNKQSKSLYAFPVAEVSGSYTIVSTADATRWYFADDISEFPSSVTWLSAETIYNFMPTYDLFLVEIQLDSELSATGVDGYLNIIEANNEVPYSLYDFYTESLGNPAYLVFENKNLSKQLTLYIKDNGSYCAPAYGIIASSPVNSHSHGNITNDGKIGTAADKVITTSTGGLLVANSTLPAGVTQTSLANLPTWTANPTDTTYLVRRDTGGSATYGQVTFLTVWNYISGKIGNITASDTTKKIYTTGTTGSGASDISNRYYDPNIYRPANNAGMLVADKFSTSESAYMTYDSTEEAIKFVFA